MWFVTNMMCGISILHRYLYTIAITFNKITVILNKWVTHYYIYPDLKQDSFHRMHILQWLITTAWHYTLYEGLTYMYNVSNMTNSMIIVKYWSLDAIHIKYQALLSSAPSGQVMAMLSPAKKTDGSARPSLRLIIKLIRKPKATDV